MAEMAEWVKLWREIGKGRVVDGGGRDRSRALNTFINNLRKEVKGKFVYDAILFQLLNIVEEMRGTVIWI